MVPLPLAAAATSASASTDNNNNNNNNGWFRRYSSKCWPSSRIKWTPELILQAASNIIIISGTLIALGFAIYAVKDVTPEYIILTIFIVGGTLFGGACLLALVNVSWMSRRPGRRISAIQIICNVVLFLITAYLELLFWPYPLIAYSILFGAGLPMLILVNLPSCFEKKISVSGEGETVCLEQDACDDMTIDPVLDPTQRSNDSRRDWEDVAPIEDLIVVSLVPEADDHETITVASASDTTTSPDDDDDDDTRHQEELEV